MKSQAQDVSAFKQKVTTWLANDAQQRSNQSLPSQTVQSDIVATPVPHQAVTIQSLSISNTVINMLLLQLYLSYCNQTKQALQVQIKLVIVY